MFNQLLFEISPNFSKPKNWFQKIFLKVIRAKRCFTTFCSRFSLTKLSAINSIRNSKQVSFNRKNLILYFLSLARIYPCFIKLKTLSQPLFTTIDSTILLVHLLKRQVDVPKLVQNLLRKHRVDYS